MRAGIGALTFVDGDAVAPSNLNRQIVALHSTLGRNKAEVMKERALDIAPECRVRAVAGFFGADRADEFDFSAYDYVADCIDSVKSKILLISRARAAGVPVTLFAPPSGAYDEDTVNAAESLGLRTVMWSRDTIDWRDKDEQTCYLRATDNLEAGELILMHPMEHTLAALPRILQYCNTHSLRPITVSENLANT